MYKLFLYLFFSGCILLTNGCSTKTGMFISATLNPLQSDEITFNDGHTSNYYTIQKGSADKTGTWLFFIGGSGNVSHNYYLLSYFDELPGSVTIYALQKRFVGHRETGLFEASQLFHQYNHYSQLVQDQKAFIQTILNSGGHKVKRVVLFGVSEGGNVASQVAAEVPEITHLMLLGSGGMAGLDEFTLWGKKQGIDFDQIYQKVLQNPESIEHKVLGHTYKYWASILDVNPMTSLEKLNIPIFAAIGGADEMVPVESVHFLRNEFNRRRKQNLTVKIFPDCNHILDDPAGVNHRGELLRTAAQWWQE